ncbi:hypothetical protein FFIC_282520 [Fructobacillus ficulneus]|uniref:Uncharacterized protein n=1 Tax=Fructobacillus ficulneus TaxID=157463 RepID=A0A0K8MIF7_9LACO|nr:hypothetical protein FFIC_282520 [Fructobacillus ficulneus]
MSPSDFIAMFTNIGIYHLMLIGIVIELIKLIQKNNRLNFGRFTVISNN